MPERLRRWIGIAGVIGLAGTLWSHPEFGPPIIAGFSLGLVGLLIGGVAGLLIVGYQAVKSK